MFWYSNSFFMKTFLLASASPRRQELLKSMGINYRYVKIDVEENYDNNLKGAEITDYLAELKSKAILELRKEEILITADTIVWHNGKALGKPLNRENAKAMLLSMSDSTHQVYSSVCVRTCDTSFTINDCTNVSVKKLLESDVEYYLNQNNFMDKAGSYGIQNWFGMTCVSSIEGSYYNVVGLPTEKLYNLLVDLKLI